LRADRSDLRLLRKEIADLRSFVGQSNVEGMLQSLESGYAHLVQRLDEMSRASVDPDLLESMAYRLQEIETAFRVVPRGDQILQLDDRIADVGARLEDMLRRTGGVGFEAIRDEIASVRALVEQVDVRDLVSGIDERLRS